MTLCGLDPTGVGACLALLHVVTRLTTNVKAFDELLLRMRPV